MCQAPRRIQEIVGYTANAPPEYDFAVRVGIGTKHRLPRSAGDLVRKYRKLIGDSRVPISARAELHLDVVIRLCKRVGVAQVVRRILGGIGERSGVQRVGKRINDGGIGVDDFSGYTARRKSVRRVFKRATFTGCGIPPESTPNAAKPVERGDCIFIVTIPAVSL